MSRARELFSYPQAALRATAKFNHQNRNNVPKGYSFVGLTQNLEVTLSSIGSIPTTYDWTRTNTTAFKGTLSHPVVLYLYLLEARQCLLRFHDQRHQRRFDLDLVPRADAVATV
jgi:hypothetical protein